ncbi:MAG: OsmC family protein [Bdellovibrionota bacterium]
MKFSSTDGNNTAKMDTQPPMGDGSALSPKQLCLAAICGCTGIDVTGLLKKYKQKVDSFHMEADAPVTEGYPAVFAFVQLDFFLQGEIEEARAIEAVQLSQTKYCGVSAMFAKACPIRYQVFLNGTSIHQGEAAFP